MRFFFFFVAPIIVIFTKYPTVILPLRDFVRDRPTKQRYYILRPIFKYGRVAVSRRYNRRVQFWIYGTDQGNPSTSVRDKTNVIRYILIKI